MRESGTGVGGDLLLTLLLPLMLRNVERVDERILRACEEVLLARAECVAGAAREESRPEKCGVRHDRVALVLLMLSVCVLLSRELIMLGKDLTRSSVRPEDRCAKALDMQCETALVSMLEEDFESRVY